ncbi:MAG: hypothetical protein PUG74_00595 [Prevotellaceae bacterium]|uniref:hypothetical protein n=1 Tax=Prevotella sp. TaxID=59823 RepID=UPI002A32C68D|nr:hypothetical protein [Prevotella sp.]MDD7317171.1 hypothetical protein [Prevotellaceae bacterium]
MILSDNGYRKKRSHDVESQLPSLFWKLKRVEMLPLTEKNITRWLNSLDKRLRVKNAHIFSNLVVKVIKLQYHHRRGKCSDNQRGKCRSKRLGRDARKNNGRKVFPGKISKSKLIAHLKAVGLACGIRTPLVWIG